MNKVILIVFSGLLAVQLVSAQSHTTWAAAQVPGLEGVPVSLLAVPGNSPGLRVMYNALKTDKRILDLLKAGILAPLSNSILFVPGGKTMLQTTKTTVVETMTSESAIQDKKSPDTENVKTNAPKENNVLIKPNTQNAGLNLDILGNKLKKMPEMPDMKLDIAVETSDLPIKKVKIPKRKKNISRRRSRKRVSKRGLGSKKLKPVISPFKAAIVQPSGQPVEKIGTMSSQRRPVYNQDIEGANTIVRSDIVQEVSVPKVVNVALDYDSKALTDTLLVMLKTMHMIQKYIKDSLTTTTTTTTTSTTTTPTTTTTTTTRPTTSTSPYYRILSTVPTTTPTTTTPSPTTEATSTEFYMTDMTTTDIETTTEDYRPVDSSADNKANSELAPDVVDFIQAFKKAIPIQDKTGAVAVPMTGAVQADIKPADLTTNTKGQKQTSSLTVAFDTKSPSSERKPRRQKVVAPIPPVYQEKPPGRMTTPPADFPDHVIDFAVSQIITAPTENKAAYAAARVYNPVLDMADKVQQALERRVLQLRYPNGLPYPGFKPQIDVMIDLVIPAYYKTLNINARQQKGRFGTQSANPWAGASQPVGPPARQPAPSPPAGPPAGPAMGPPTSIRRGFRPRGAAGMYSPFEPTQWELNQAVHDIHLAKTEAQAVKAAAGVHRIGLDLADMVVNALEEKIARLRNPHWNRYHPPPIPRRLDVHRLVRDAVFEIQRVERAKAQAAAAAAAKEKKTPPPPSPRAGSRVPTTMPPTAPPKPNQNPRKPSNPRPRPSPKKTKPSRGDFMTDFIQNRRKQRQPPPASKLFKQAHITRPPYVQPVRRQTVDPFLTQPPVPKYFEPTKITRPPFVPPARREPVDPFLSQSSYRPKPQAEPFRPPPNVPTPPKINWHKKAALRPVPTSIAPTTAEKGPSSISASSIPEQTSSNSYKSPSAVSYETVANQKSAKPAFMRIPKPNIPPAPFRSEPPKPISLFSKGNSGRPSDIPKAVLSSNKGNVKKPSRETIAPSIESTETTPSPEEQQLFNRYPGLFENKAKMRAANLAQHRLEAVGPSAEISKPPLKVPSPQSPKVPKKIPVTNPPQQAALKVAPKIIKPSKVWSPLGNLGSNINEILKFSIDGPSESVPIPTAAPLTTKAPTTTTKKPTTTARRKQQKVKPIRKTKVKRRRKVVSKAKSKSIAIKLAKKKEEIPKKPKGADKLTQLHKLLEGISPSQLQTLVDLIKAKANEGKPKPLPKSESLPKPKPIFAPPPPPVIKPRWQRPGGSEHKGPPREFRQMQNSRNGPYRPNGDYGPPPDSRGPPPDWARGPGGRSRGPPGPPGPGGPRGPGGPGGPGMRGGPDLNNPQIARLIRVIKTGGHPKHNFLSGRTPGSSAAAAGGEAPEAGEGPTGLLGNPLMMSMLMNRGGQGGGGGIASLLGGAAGGANPLAALMPGGAGGAGGGGNPLSMLQGLGGLPGSGGAGASSEGGMNPAMLAAIMGGGQGGGGGLGALGSLFGGGSAGGLGGLGAAMMNPDGPDFLTSGGPAMTALLSAAASGQTPSNSADPQPTAGASTNSLSTGAAAYPSKTSEANAAITDALNSINSGQKLSANTIQKTAEPTATLVIQSTPVKPKKPRGKGKRQQRWGPKKSKVIKPPSQISDPFSGSQEKTSGTNQVQGQQISWKPSPFPIPDLQTNVNDQQQSGKAPRWQQKRRNMFNNRRKQNQFQRKQDRMGVKGQGKNRQSINVGSLSTTDMLGKFKPTQQTWQITKGKPKMPRNNNNRGISVGFPRSNQKSNKPGRPDKRGRGKKPQDPKGSGKTIGDMMQNLFKGGAPPGATGGMPNMPGPLGGGGDAAGLGALLGLGGSGDLPMMPPGQSGAGGLEALFGMGGGAGQGAGGGEGLGGLGALMGLGGAGGSGSNPLEALLGAGGTGSGSNPLQALLGAGGTGSGSNPLEALLGAGGTGSGSNPLEALLGAGGAGSGSNPLEALLGAGGAGAGSNPLDALLGGGGAGSSDPLSGLFGKEKPGKPGKPGRGRPPFGKPPFGKPPFGKPPFGKPPFGKPPFGKPPFGKPFPPPKGGPGSLLPFLGRNPMGPGRPLIPGMTPGQVSDLMGGQPGPVPMDIANQADLMSKMGHTVDHIVDVLGDVLQQRRSMPGYAAAALAAGSFPGMGLGNPGGQGKPGRKQGRHV